jgi:hypothetical protein
MRTCFNFPPPQKLFGAVSDVFPVSKEDPETTLHVNFELQIASRSSSAEELPLSMWSCHWGTRSVSVHAGYRFMDRVKYSSELHGVVAIGLRDGTSFSSKARTAQVC